MTAVTDARPRRTLPADDAPHLLVVDDDRRIRDLLSRFLADHGYRITTAPTAADARRRLQGLAFDLLIVDVMMPGESGFDLVKSIRTDSTVPILMLTARSETDSRIRGFETGADDYLAKPFEPRELLLRIAAILKRAAPAAGPRAVESVRFGDFVLHLARGELRRNGEIVHLTDRERELLTLLAERAGETVHRTELGGRGPDANDRAVDVQINRLRRKVEVDPADPRYIQTVRGIGYRLVIAI